jgi:hypothetical protein
LERLQKQLESVEISLPRVEKKILLKRACGHYNYMQDERACYGRSHSDIPATLNSDKEFLDRITVNYLRHCLTDYEELLDEISGKVGFAVGYFDIREKIFKKIIEYYPWLETECKRQNGEIQEEERKNNVSK